MRKKLAMLARDIRQQRENTYTTAQIRWMKRYLAVRRGERKL